VEGVEHDEIEPHEKQAPEKRQIECDHPALLFDDLVFGAQGDVAAHTPPALKVIGHLNNQLDGVSGARKPVYFDFGLGLSGLQPFAYNAAAPRQLPVDPDKERRLFMQRLNRKTPQPPS
jgi:hypothetical protein